MTTRVTPTDRENELRVAKLIERAWGVRVLIFPDEHAGLDYVIERDGRVLSLGELKCRPGVKSSTYPTVYLSQRKANLLRAAGDTFRVRGTFFVEHDDGLRWFQVYPWTMPQPIPRPRVLGRVDRDPPSPNDLEPIHEIPISWLSLVRSPSGYVGQAA